MLWSDVCLAATFAADSHFCLVNETVRIWDKFRRYFAQNMRTTWGLIKGKVALK